MLTARLVETPSSSSKKFMVQIRDEKYGRQKTVFFGARGYEDFTVHKDEERKRRYLARHSARENWSDPFTAGFWSAHLLWNKRSVQESMRDIARQFQIRFI